MVLDRTFSLNFATRDSLRSVCPSALLSKALFNWKYSQILLLFFLKQYHLLSIKVDKNVFQINYPISFVSVFSFVCTSANKSTTDGYVYSEFNFGQSAGLVRTRMLPTILMANQIPASVKTFCHTSEFHRAVRVRKTLTSCTKLKRISLQVVIREI